MGLRRQSRLRPTRSNAAGNFAAAGRLISQTRRSRMAAHGQTLEFPAVREKGGEQIARQLLRRFGIRVDGVDTWRFGRAQSANDVSRVLAEPTELWMSRFRPTDRRLVF